MARRLCIASMRSHPHPATEITLARRAHGESCRESARTRCVTERSRDACGRPTTWVVGAVVSPAVRREIMSGDPPSYAHSMQMTTPPPSLLRRDWAFVKAGEAQIARKGYSPFQHSANNKRTTSPEVNQTHFCVIQAKLSPDQLPDPGSIYTIADGPFSRNRSRARGGT